MSITTAHQTLISQLYVAFFNRAAEGAGLGHWANDLANGRPIQEIAQNFYISSETGSVYSGALTNSQFIEKFYQTVMNRSADKEGLDYWTAQLNLPGKEQGSVVVDIINALLSDQSQNPVVVASQAAFNAKVSVSTAYALANGPLAGAHAVLTGVTDQASADAAIAAIGQGTIGQTFTLTHGIDNLHGTNGNDIFIADNTGAVKALTAANAVDGGAGNNTLKVYLADTDQGAALNGVLHIQNLYMHGGLPAVASLNVSTLTDLKNVELDSPAIKANDKIGLTIGDGQAVKLSNIAVDFEASIAGNTATTANVTLNKVSGTATLQINGTSMAALQLTAAGSNVAVSVENAGAALNQLFLNGDKNMFLTPDAKTAQSVTLIDASGNTGNVVIDASSGIKQTDFKFIGGKGDTALYLAKGDLAALQSGSQLEGGAGHNTLRIAETSFDASGYKMLDTVKNFQTLSFNNDTISIDASKVTAFKAFEANGGTLSVAGIKDGFNVTLAANQDALTLAKQAGSIKATSTVNVGEDASNGITIGMLKSDHLLSLVSNGDNTKVNTITVFDNYANNIVNVAGDNDLTFSLSNAGTINASSFTGKLAVTSSGGNDVLVGGVKDDTFIIKAAADTNTTATVSGGAGNDTFNVGAAKAGTGATVDAYSKTLITDFSHGDTVLFGTNSTFTESALTAAATDTLAIMLNKAITSNGTAEGLISWFNFENNTYLVDDLSSATAMNAEVIVVQLTGLHDFSQAKIDNGALILA